MKKILIAVVLCLMFSITPVFANSTHIGGTDNNTINNNSSATGGSSSASVGNVSATGGAGGTGYGGSAKVDNNIGNGIGNFSPSASASIERGAVQNTNVGINMNKNTNIGVNKQDQDQKQAQGQLQGQLQGQMIQDSANTSNSNNAKQETSVMFEAKRELVPIASWNAPSMTEFRGPYDKGTAGKVRPWEIKKSWTDEEVKGMYSAFDDADCKIYPIKKIDSGATANLNVGRDSEVKAIIDCKGTSDFTIWGTAATKAMSYGATSINQAAYAVTFSNKATGWNIGIGGGVSIVGQGSDDNKGGSVGGGTGFGSVETKPVENISVIFFVR